MENKELIGQIRQRLEILYQMFEQLEQGGGSSPTDAYTKAQTDALLNGKVDKVAGSSLMTTAQANKLAGIESGAEVNVQADWSQSDTTADDFIKNKPVIPDTSDFYTKTEVDSELSGKVDKQTGYSLISDANITKLNGIAAGAEVNVQADWNQTNTTADSYIKNKPTIPDLTNYYNKTETNAEIQGAITDLDVASTSQSGHYIDYIAQEDGLIVPHAELAATSVIPSSTKLITSGAVSSALSNYYTSSEASLDQTLIYNYIALNGVKNKFNFDAWKVVPVNPNQGSTSYTDDGTFTINVNSGSSSCFTAYGMSGTYTYPEAAVIPVKEGRGYIFSFEAGTIPSGAEGQALVFRNGQTTGSDIIGNTQKFSTSGRKSVNFTAPTGCTFVTIRFDVYGAGQSITYSNIMIRDNVLSNNTYEPYAPSNRELYELIMSYHSAAAATNLNRELVKTTLEKEEDFKESSNGDER